MINISTIEQELAEIDFKEFFEPNNLYELLTFMGFPEEKAKDRVERYKTLVHKPLLDEYNRLYKIDTKK